MRRSTHNFTSLLLLAILLWQWIPAKAQSYYFRHYQVENGLSNNTVFGSTQDSSGFLWFGTKDGLNRFDGYHFKQYNIRNVGFSMTPDMITSMTVDRKNTLWVGSQKGLFYFDRQTESLVSFIDSLAWINNMQLDNNGQLWFISAVMLCRYDFNTKTLTRFPEANFFQATAITKTQDGEIWISTPNGYLQRYDAAQKKFKAYNVFEHSPAAISNWIQKIYADSNRAIFVGTASQGLKKFDLASKTYTDILTYNEDKTTVHIRDIARYKGDEFWFASESGIFILDNSTGKFTNLKKKSLDPYSLSDNALYSLCKDSEGGIWAGTYFGGINYYSEQYTVFRKYFPDNSGSSISGSAVREICEDSIGNLWIGTEDAGLNKLNLATGAITQFKPSGKRTDIAYSNIHGLLVSGKELWIGLFDYGLDIMDVQSGKVTRHYESGPGKHELKNSFIVTMLKTRSGEIYVGTGAGIYHFNKQLNGFDKITAVAENIFVAALLEDKAGTIWVGTHGNGVFYFKPGTNEHGHFDTDPAVENGLTNNIINALFEDSKKNLWIATEGGGLIKLDSARKTFSSVTTQQGLPSNFIFKVLEDDAQQLWITTSRGLVKYDPGSAAVIIYTKDNGLLNDQFNYNSGYKDDNGNLYFGSVKGMIRFRPDAFRHTASTPPVYITAFQVKNKELEIDKDSSFLKQSIIFTDEITLPYDQSSISIDFAALGYISPEMTAYRYFLKGLDKEWTDIKPNRKIYFTNLAPGKYVFRLKAAINGVWGQQEKQLIIRILPPFWATWWAYLLYIILAAVLGWYLLRTYHIIVQDKKEKEIYEAKIDFFTNVAHEIRTPLTLIKGPVDNLLEKVEQVPEIKDDVLTMDRNTNRLIALITQILDFRQTETKGFSINFARINITDLLQDFHQTFSNLAHKKKLQYTIEVPTEEVVAFADEEALNKILSNLYNNAIKYAEANVTVRLLLDSDQADSFIIEFFNDGPLIPEDMSQKIFEPFYRLKEVIKKQGTGLGLALARSLAELHGGRLYLKEQQPPSNVFVLTIPLKTESLTKAKFKLK
ncbi:MAG: two-component regulator propeller domain-containing protein [Bacteroidota bacterium]